MHSRSRCRFPAQCATYQAATAARSQRLTLSPRPADWKSAIQQVGNLRYGANAVSWSALPARQLENDLAQTGQMLSSAAAGAIASTSAPPFIGGLSSNQVMGLSVLSIIFVLFPLAAGLGRAIFRRANKPGVPPQVLTETAQRLEHLESAVDAIAIEIERISEGQRFVTKLLSEGQPTPMIGSGAATPVRASK